MQLNKNEIDVVFYHRSCSDGYGSAFIVWYYYKSIYGIDRANQIAYFSDDYSKNVKFFGGDFLQKINGKNVLMCDFVYNYDQLLQIIDCSKTFMILNHSKSTDPNLKKIPEKMKIINLKKSGCGIIWDFFYPDTPIPNFLAHIQDREIRTFKMPYTLEFMTFFYYEEFRFGIWEKYLDNNIVQKAIDIGTHRLEYQNILVDKIIEKTSYVIQEINNQYTIILYINTSDLKSDISDKVLTKYPVGDFSCIWNYDLNNNQTFYNLYSTNDRMDVSVISKMYGGSGHHDASEIIFPEVVGCLPFKRIEDLGILTLLMHGQKGKINIVRSEYSYTIFKVNEIQDKWISEKYFNLIKRKCNDSSLIVFEKQSDSVQIENNMEDIIPFKEYILYYNEKAMDNPEKQLQLMVFRSANNALTFTSSKDFSVIFDDMDKDNEYQISDSDSDDR